MKIIALLNEKGGVGKSTLASNLATGLHRRNRRVVLVDADPQGTARDWRAASPPDADLPPVVALDRPQLLSSITTLSADLVVIDGPGKAEAMAAAIVRIANTALVVIQPSGADIWASAAAVKLIQAKRDVGGKIEAAFVLNRISAGTRLSRAVREGDWNEYEIGQLKSTLANRVAFAQSLTDGVSIYESNDIAAQAEMDKILDEMEDLAWL